MNREQTTSTLVEPVLVVGSSSVTASTPATAHQGTKGMVWPAVALLAVMPTANIQTFSSFLTSNETCVRRSRWREEENVGCTYEVYSSWYAPSWEEIKVPSIPTVSHAKAKLRFRGSLKWQPYNP